MNRDQSNDTAPRTPRPAITKTQELEAHVRPCTLKVRGDWSSTERSVGRSGAPQLRQWNELSLVSGGLGVPLKGARPTRTTRAGSRAPLDRTRSRIGKSPEASDDDRAWSQHGLAPAPSPRAPIWIRPLCHVHRAPPPTRLLRDEAGGNPREDADRRLGAVEVPAIAASSAPPPAPGSVDAGGGHALAPRQDPGRSCPGRGRAPGPR